MSAPSSHTTSAPVAMEQPKAPPPIPAKAPPPLLSQASTSPTQDPYPWAGFKAQTLPSPAQVPKLIPQVQTLPSPATPSKFMGTAANRGRSSVRAATPAPFPTPVQGSIPPTLPDYVPPRNVLMDNDPITHPGEILPGTKLDTIPVWRLPVGYYYDQWMKLNGIQRTFNRDAQQGHSSRAFHKQYSNGPLYTDPSEDCQAGGMGGWRIHVQNLPIRMDAHCMLDLIRIDFKDDPNFTQAVIYGPIRFHLSDTQETMQAFLTVATQVWAAIVFEKNVLLVLSEHSRRFAMEP